MLLAATSVKVGLSVDAMELIRMECNVGKCGQVEDWGKSNELIVGIVLCEVHFVWLCTW